MGDKYWFRRGARVQCVLQQRFNLLSGQSGTVTHFNGDPGYDSLRDNEVWVDFDNGESTWASIELLISI